MKSGFHFFRNVIEVDCSAHPINPSPVATAVTAEIAKIRDHSDKPIFVLAGEWHAYPEQVLLPFAFMLRNGLLSSTSPSALLGRFQMSLEVPHNMLANFLCHRVAFTPPDQQTVNMMVESDFAGERLLHSLQTISYAHARHARYFLQESLLDGEIKTLANDAAYFSYENSPGVAPHIIDPTDDETGSLIRLYGYGGTDIHVLSPVGMAIRNTCTALRLKEKGMEKGMVTWHQGGALHILGDERKNLEFRHSLVAALRTIIGPDEAHTIVVLPLDVAGFNEESVPDATVGFESAVIGVRGLSQSLPATAVEECLRANDAILAIFDSAGRKAERVLMVPPLQLEDYQNRCGLIANTLVPQWEAAAKRCIQERKSGGVAEPRPPALS